MLSLIIAIYGCTIMHAAATRTTTKEGNHIAFFIGNAVVAYAVLIS